jgi:HEAT repeat protein
MGIFAKDTPEPRRLAFAGDLRAPAPVNPTAQRTGRSEQRAPSVHTLSLQRDVDGLVEAVGFEDLLPGSDGGTVDLGAQVREEAILALGALGPEAGNGSISGALTDASDRVRMAAVRVLHDRGESEAIAESLAWLPSEAGNSREMAIEALTDLNRPDCARTLASALVRAGGENPIAEEEQTLLLVLLDRDSESAAGVVEELVSALSDDRAIVSQRAEDLLATLGPTSIDGVIAELRAGAAADRAAAVLGRIKATRAMDSLVEALEHSAAAVRAESAAALGELRDPAAVEPLLRATRDPDHAVRAQAGWALDRIGTVAVIVGVSHLVRPMIQEVLSPAPEPEALPETTDGETMDGETTDGPAAEEGPPRETRLRRVARFLDRLEDARAGQ